MNCWTNLEKKSWLGRTLYYGAMLLTIGTENFVRLSKSFARYCSQFFFSSCWLVKLLKALTLILFHLHVILKMFQTISYFCSFYFFNSQHFYRPLNSFSTPFDRRKVNDSHFFLFIISWAKSSRMILKIYYSFSRLCKVILFLFLFFSFYQFGKL